MKKILSILVFCLAASEAVYASDVQPQQVMIEPRILYVTQKDRDVTSEFAFVFSPLKNNQTKVEATTITYGRGVDFRRWVPQSSMIMTPAKERIRPTESSRIYVPKSSLAQPIAPFLFAAIGSQYEAPGVKAASSPGSICPITGKPLSESENKRGDIANTIDKAGMAAGMGLLASQAKGELQGLKTTFFLNENMSVLLSLKPEKTEIKDIPLLNYQFRTETKHKEKNNLIIVITPMLVQDSGEHSIN